MGPGTPAVGLVERRIRSLLRAADLRASGVGLGELADLMPDGGPASDRALAEWFERSPGVGVLRDGRVYLPSAERGRRDDGSLGAVRAAEFTRAAQSLVDGPLGPIRPLCSSILVTGSTAYGAPGPNDDIDLFLIARRGTLWTVLAFAFLRFRFQDRRAPPASRRAWCLNYVLEEDAARREFRSPRGFLFAREALSAIPLWGADAYRDLLASAPWLREEAPRLYDRWEAEPSRAPAVGPAPSRWLRAANAILFPFVATYLHAQGIYRNGRMVRKGRASERFRTITRFDRFVIRSEKFDELVDVYRGSSAVTAVGTSPTPPA